MRHGATTLFAGFLLLASGAPPVAASPTPGIAEGAPFPSIVLTTLDDSRPMSLADFRGEKVVLHVFASW